MQYKVKITSVQNPIPFMQFLRKRHGVTLVEAKRLMDAGGIIYEFRDYYEQSQLLLEIGNSATTEVETVAEASDIPEVNFHDFEPDGLEDAKAWVNSLSDQDRIRLSVLKTYWQWQCVPSAG